jgi:mono/diheme cytochrome c family protein
MKTALLASLALLALAGCDRRTSRSAPLEPFPDMVRQDKYKPQQARPFFADGRASRRPVAGTVAVGQLQDDDVFYTGLVNESTYAGRNPLPLTADTLARGRERFDIYCAPCHDRTGSGHGIVPTRTPSWLPSNLLEDRIRKMSDGELFSVASLGRRSMPGYRFQTDEHDRWAIVAYVRALQRATAATAADVPADLKSELR